MKAITNNTSINWEQLKQKHLSFCLKDINVPNQLDNIFNINDNKPQITDPLGIIPEIRENLKDILTGNIERLNQLQHTLEPLLGDNPNLKKALLRVFSHKTFVKRSAESWGAFMFFKTLGVAACPYCNRQYINTTKRRYQLNRNEIVNKFDLETYEKVKNHQPNLKLTISHF